jgi:hypothetical protein
MFLASRGFWSGNPEQILEAPANLVLSALDFSIRKEKEKVDLITGIVNGIAGGLR